MVPEGVGPLAERLAADLEKSVEKLQGLSADLDFYSKSFQQAMILAGVGDISMKILKTLGPARLAGGAPTPELANGITWGFQMLKFMQDPVKWSFGSRPIHIGLHLDKDITPGSMGSRPSSGGAQRGQPT